jgi:glycosyltransferase involved in cell wall biosynthesis
MNKRSIAIFAPQFRSTGVAPAMLSLGMSLQSNGHNVELISSVVEWSRQRGGSDSFPVKIYRMKAGALLRLLPAQGRLRFRISNVVAGLILLVSLVFYLRRRRPDVMIVAMQPLIAVIASLIARSDVKVVISIQGAPRPGKFRIWLWKLLWRKSDAIVCESKSIAARLASILDVVSSSLHVIYNPHYDAGIIEQAKSETSHAAEFKLSAYTAVAMGRLTPQKGFDVALRAIKIANEQIDLRLLVIGSGNELGRLEDLRSNLGLDNRVVFLGQIQNPYPILAGSDVFISSSRWEGLARAPIEAQTLGVPVIVTDIEGGARETVLDGQAGVLVGADDPEALSRGIVDLLTDGNRMSEVVEVASQEIGRFSSERVASEYLSVIETILDF